VSDERDPDPGHGTDVTAVTSPSDAPEAHGATFWIGLVIGGAVMAFGIRGVLMQSAATRPAELARYVIGADLLHDLLFAPIVIALGWVVVRLVPRAWSVPVQAGLVASGVVALVGWAAWRGYGHATVPDNPTVQPLDYTTAILTVWGIVWVAVAVWIAVRARHRRANGARPTGRE
jgi:hypothetical protein